MAVAKKIHTLRARYPGGKPATGFVTATPAGFYVDDTDSALVPPQPVRASFDSAGIATLRLDPTTGPDVTPDGWTWKITERIDGITNRAPYSITVPADAPSPRDLRQLSPAPPSTGSIPPLQVPDSVIDPLLDEKLPPLIEPLSTAVAGKVGKPSGSVAGKPVAYDAATGRLVDGSAAVQALGNGTYAPLDMALAVQPGIRPWATALASRASQTARMLVLAHSFGEGAATTAAQGFTSRLRDQLAARYPSAGTGRDGGYVPSWHFSQNTANYSVVSGTAPTKQSAYGYGNRNISIPTGSVVLLGRRRADHDQRHGCAAPAGEDQGRDPERVQHDRLVPQPPEAAAPSLRLTPLANAGVRALTPTKEGPSMIPSIGRTVHYTLSATEAQEVNRRRADAVKHHTTREADGAVVHRGNAAREGDVLPMLIVRLWGEDEDSLVNGQVFLDGNDSLWVTSRAQGHEPGQWHQPPRV